MVRPEDPRMVWLAEAAGTAAVTAETPEETAALRWGQGTQGAVAEGLLIQDR